MMSSESGQLQAALEQILVEIRRQEITQPCSWVERTAFSGLSEETFSLASRSSGSS